MKHYTTILILLIVLMMMPFYATSQQYHPFPEQNAYWTVYEFNQNYGYWDTYIYTIKGDTVINSRPYKKIWQLDDEPGTNDTLWYLHSFMRQDTLQKKVWFIRRYMNETTEKLGYDFDVQIGDTVNLPAFDYENSGDSIFVLIDPGWDSTQLWNGEYRKNFFYANLNHNIGLDPYVIEGVGTQRTPFPNLFYFDSFHQSILFCHKVNGVQLYGDTIPYSFCDFTVDINEIMPKQTVTVKPNPCNNFVEILFPENINTEIETEIINSYGQVVYRNGTFLQHNEIRINTAIYQNGLYIIKTTTKKDYTFFNKIIIKH